MTNLEEPSKEELETIFSLLDRKKEESERERKKLELTKLKKTLDDHIKQWEKDLFRIYRRKTYIDPNHVCTMACTMKPLDRYVYGCVEGKFLHYCNSDYSNCPWTYIHDNGLIYCVFSRHHRDTLMVHEGKYEKYTENPIGVIENSRKRRDDEKILDKYYIESEKPWQLKYSGGFGAVKTTDYYVGWINKELFNELEPVTKTLPLAAPVENKKEENSNPEVTRLLAKSKGKVNKLWKRKRKRTTNNNNNPPWLKKVKKKSSKKSRLTKLGWIEKGSKRKPLTGYDFDQLKQTQQQEEEVKLIEEGLVPVIRIIPRDPLKPIDSVFDNIPMIFKGDRKVLRRFQSVQRTAKKMIQELLYTDYIRVNIYQHKSNLCKTEYETEIQEYLDNYCPVPGTTLKMMKPILNHLQAIYFAYLSNSEQIRLNLIEKDECRLNYYVVIIGIIRIVILYIYEFMGEELTESKDFTRGSVSKKTCSDVHFVQGFLYYLSENNIEMGNLGNMILLYKDPYLKEHLPDIKDFSIHIDTNFHNCDESSTTLSDEIGSNNSILEGTFHGTGFTEECKVQKKKEIVEGHGFPSHYSETGVRTGSNFIKEKLYFLRDPQVFEMLSKTISIHSKINPI